MDHSTTSSDGMTTVAYLRPELFVASLEGPQLFPLREGKSQGPVSKVT